MQRDNTLRDEMLPDSHVRIHILLVPLLDSLALVFVAASSADSVAIRSFFVHLLMAESALRLGSRSQPVVTGHTGASNIHSVSQASH